MRTLILCVLLLSDDGHRLEIPREPPPVVTGYNVMFGISMSDADPPLDEWLWKKWVKAGESVRRSARALKEQIKSVQRRHAPSQ